MEMIRCSPWDSKIGSLEAWRWCFITFYTCCNDASAATGSRFVEGESGCWASLDPLVIGWLSVVLCGYAVVFWKLFVGAMSSMWICLLMEISRCGSWNLPQVGYFMRYQDWISLRLISAGKRLNSPTHCQDEAMQSVLAKGAEWKCWLWVTVQNFWSNLKNRSLMIFLND